VVNRLESDIADGNEINELELIYLPFFKSEKMKPLELLRKAINMANRLETKAVSKDKLFALMLVVSNKIIDKQEFDAIWEEVRMMNLTVLKIAEEKGMEKGLEKGMEKGVEIIKRHSRGEGAMDISKATNVSLKEVEHIIAKSKS